MKNYSKKVFSLLIAFLMVISLLPATVLADEPEAYSVYIGGTQVTSENLSGNGWAFSPDDNTLTLTNVNIGGAGGIAVSSDAKAGIYANGIDLTIVGTGSITGPMGICVENGSLTISGDAEAEAPTTVLTVKSSAADDDAIYSAVSVTIENSKVTIPYAGDDGISSHEGDLTIENSILDITADYGLYSDESDIFIKNSTVDIHDAYYAIYNGSSIAITDDSKVTVTESEYGLYTDYDITITDSEVNVTAEEYGIYSDYAEVVIENSTVNVNDCYYYGIRAYEDYDEDGVSLTIEGSEVTLTDCYGDYSVIYAYYDSIEISENSKVAIKQTDSEDSYGYAYYNIYVYYGGFAIKDSSLTVDNSYCYGVYADGSYNEDACILVDSSTVKLDYIMDYSGIGYVGLYADGGNVVIEDSTVIASNQEYGIWADYDIDIESSKVTAEGCEDYGIGASGAISISGATSRVSAGTDDYAIYAGDGFSLTDVTIVKPEGGAISESGKTIVDASGTTAAYVLIQGEGEVTYTVTFDANGHGTAPDPQTVEEGGRATRPANPTESGWRFGGWYLEAECVNAFDFSTPITGDITLYAKWTEAGTGGTVVTKYTLTYETNGGSAIDPAEYRKGTTVELTETPVREGYTFTGWYSEPELINKITSIKMDEDKTVYAGWEESAPAGFTDVPEDAWYKEAVDYVAENGIMSGVGNNKFDPLGTTTRGMIVTILYGLEGKPAVSGSSPFDDVAEGQWYTDAVIWANANGIVAGYGNGKFGPTDNITREQFATILYVYAQYKGYDTAKAADLSGYADAADISAYAVNAMKWANAEGMITGRTATTLVPGGNATRAEAAAIFKQFTENVK